MKREETFALSPTEAKRVAMLFVAYGLLLVAAAGYYYIVSGDQRFPLPYLFQVALAGVCAWGINSRRRWALVLGGVFAAWYVYDGVSSLILFLNGGGWNSPAPAKIIMGLLAIRTLLLIVLLLLLLYYSSRKRPDSP